MSSIRLPIPAMLVSLLVLVVACGVDAPEPAAPRPADPAVGAAVVALLPATPQPALPSLPAAPQVLPTPVPTPTAMPAPVRFLDQPPAPAPVQFPLTVTDTNGNELTFDRPPERIVAYDSAVVEILFAIGEGHRVIGTHDFVSYPPEADDVPRLGGAFDINVEAIVALEPDLVYLFFDRFQPDLERAGVKVLYIQTLSNDFTRVADQIRLWGQITDSPGEAEEVALEFERRVDRIAGMVASQRPGASIFQDIGGFWTPGSGTLVGEVFELLNLRNVASDISGYAQLSPEVIVEKNPHVILTTDRNAILDNPAFANIAAVRNGQVFDLNSTLLSVAGPRFVDGIEELAQLVYPALFR